MRAERK